MLALTCRLSRIGLPSALAASQAASAVTQQQQPRRNTVVVTRKHELDRPYPELDGAPMREIGDYPDRVPIYSKFYETAEVHALRPDSQQLISVRLAQDVPGLGESGRTVSVHRSRYWHYLHPLGWASIAVSQQQQQQQQVPDDWRNSRVFTGALYRLQRTLEAMHLLVPISRDAAKAAPGASLSERHLCVAFRRYGLEIPRRAIRLPDKKLPALNSVAAVSASAAAARTFKVGVQLNNVVTVAVTASLHPVTLGESGSGLPAAQLPRVEVDDWLAEMHPQPKLPEGVRLFENYMLRQGPPDFELLLRSNRAMIKTKK